MTALGETQLDHRLLRALGHPLRQRILALLHERVASPSEMANELGEPIGNVSYHVKVLRDNEAIELVQTRPVRGAVEHFYRPVIRPFLDDEHWARLPAASRRALFANTVREIFDHVSQAAAGGGFEDVQTHVSWTHLELDEVAYAQLSQRLGELIDYALELEADSVNRRAADPATTRASTELALMHFHRTPAKSAARDGRARREHSPSV
jgi:DNA-binding transcriptional ArsR family regulator